MYILILWSLVESETLTKGLGVELLCGVPLPNSRFINSVLPEFLVILEKKVF